MNDILPGTFPFGWVRDFEDDNWQILWNKDSGQMFLKSIINKKTHNICNVANWLEAKNIADGIINNPSELDINT